MKYILYRSFGDLDKDIKKHELVAVETGRNIDDVADALIKAAADDLAGMPEYEHCETAAYAPEPVKDFRKVRRYQYEMTGIVYPPNADKNMMIERVKQNKSLVDVMLISRTCQEHYKNNVDSFILVSSDSDYWGLISSLQDARFLVMIERESCGPDLKNALSDAGIFYCYIDDFYSGNTEDIKQGALFKEMYRYIDNAVRLNIFEMFDEAIRTTRIEMSSAEKQQFISQYVKTMQMRITDSGDVVLEFKRK